jgi:hypothetical protein
MMKAKWIVVTGALLCVTALRAQNAMIDGRGVDGMLQRAASVLFHIPDGELLDFTKQYEHLRYEDSCEIARYRVQTEAGANVGDILRLRVYPEGQSTVDLALVMGSGQIERAEPMRTVIVNGVPLFDFAPSVVGLKEEELADGTADGLAKVFAGLAFVEQSFKLPVNGPTEDQGRKIVAALRLVRPALTPGSKLPAVSSLDEGGHPFTTTGFKGRNVVFFMGGVDDPDERAVLAWTQQYLTDHPNSFQLVEALQNLPASIAEYRTLGGQTMGTVVPDLDGTLYDAFRTATMPTLFLYDKSGQLVQMIESPINGPEAVKAALDKLTR